MKSTRRHITMAKADSQEQHFKRMLHQNFGNVPYQSIFDTQEKSQEEKIGSAKDILQNKSNRRAKRTGVNVQSEFAKTE